MKKSLLGKSTKPSRTTQEIHTVAIIVIAAAVVVLSCTVAVLLAQADGHRDSIKALEQALSISE